MSANFKLYEVGQEIAGRTIKGVGYDHHTMSSQRYGVRYRCGHEDVLRHIDIKRAAAIVVTGLCAQCAQKAPRIEDTPQEDLCYPEDHDSEARIRTHAWSRTQSDNCESGWVNVR